jgi:alkyl sulfatase BDS1-like metallo-beta-lactamase superfamily hydrolase
MGAIRETAEKLWRGDLTVRAQHPLTPTGDTEEIADGVAFIRWFANVIIAKTTEGLVLIDTGAYFNQDQTVARVRGYSPQRVNTAIYTHGHVDHACGMPAFVAESQKNHCARPKVVGHRSVAARFDRYQRTRGYNNVINARQFGGTSSFPEEYVYPDTYYEAKVGVTAGGEKFDCYHARGETDDHTWVYIASRKVLCTGDLFIWAVPNAGNPQKVQRYAREWAEALRAMAKLSAEVLAPGHGSPIFGARNVRQALNDTAAYLESVVQQTSAMMNAGATLDEIIHSVKPPAELAEKPYLQPVYDEPEFMVRNIWRLDGGWYDGIPSHLKPASEAAQAGEIVALAGGVDKLISRAAQKLASGEIELASHLIDLAVAAEPSHKEAHRVRMEIYSQRADLSPSTMSHGIFRSAARDSARQAGEQPPASKRRF